MDVSKLLEYWSAMAFGVLVARCIMKYLGIETVIVGVSSYVAVVCYFYYQVKSRQKNS